MGPLHFVQCELIISKSCQIDNCWFVAYTKGVRKIQLPEKVRRLVVPGVLLLAILFIAGGLYFHNQSLIFSPHIPVGEEEGAVSGIRTGLPENFPEDIPLFEPAEILSSLSSQERVQVTLQTEALAERVLEFYQQKMRGLGWRLTGRGGENGVLTFTKDDRRLQLTITPNPAGSTLVILNTNT